MPDYLNRKFRSIDSTFHSWITQAPDQAMDETTPPNPKNEYSDYGAALLGAQDSSSIVTEWSLVETMDWSGEASLDLTGETSPLTFFDVSWDFVTTGSSVLEIINGTGLRIGATGLALATIQAVMEDLLAKGAYGRDRHLWLVAVCDSINTFSTGSTNDFGLIMYNDTAKTQYFAPYFIRFSGSNRSRGEMVGSASGLTRTEAIITMPSATVLSVPLLGGESLLKYETTATVPATPEAGAVIAGGAPSNALWSHQKGTVANQERKTDEELILLFADGGSGSSFSADFSRFELYERRIGATP